jgi:peptidoglycan-associated lipoprotein
MERRKVYRIFTVVGRLAMVGALAVGVGGIAACGAKAKKDTTVQTERETGKNEPLRAEITPATPQEVAPPSEPIYFDFDSYQVQESSRGVLQKVAEYLNTHPGATVTIAGHTDERGTTEYNLMLGDQRAKAAHDYLVRLGIDPVRIKTISFGEERPASPGSGEENWSKNRRDEFQTTKPR